METFDYRSMVQKQVLESLKSCDLNDPKWSEEFTKWGTQAIDSIVIWYLKELVGKLEYREYLDKIFAVAELYAGLDVPEEEAKKLNLETIAGEEIRNIYTIKGSVCWLLASIAATFETEYYSRIISILEKLANDPVYYVRIQSTVPLSFFARNIRAYKHPNGDEFKFEESDREVIKNLSFKMLREHRDLPRVLQGVVNIFDALRFISTEKAKEVIETLFYDSKTNLQPDYLTHQGVPLLMFYAEYRTDLGDGFLSKWFQDFAIELLEKKEEEAPFLRSTFIWNTWREIQSDFKNYEKFKKYIPYFLHIDTFETQSLSQYEFLVKEVIKNSFKDGLDLFRYQLKFVGKWAHKYNIRDYSPWLLDIKEIINYIAINSPDDYLEILNNITQLTSTTDLYIGDLVEIFQAYLLVVNSEKKKEIEPEVIRLYGEVRRSKFFEHLPEKL